MVLLRSRSIRISKWDRKGRLILLLFLFIIFLNILAFLRSDGTEKETDPMTHRGLQDIIKDKGKMYFEVIEVMDFLS